MKDKTKELADSVGAVYPVLFMGRHDGVLFTEYELETFVERIRAEEREACAKLCDDTVSAARNSAPEKYVDGIRMGAAACLAAIRNRGEQMIATESCWERGCACHDSRESPGVELVKKREWVGLTDEDFLEACQIAERGNYLLAFQRIQTKLKEKNT